MLNSPIVELVSCETSAGAVKVITLKLSGSIEDSSGFVLSDLRYLREGIPFLGPDERIRCLWDHIDRLIPYLREKGLQEGVAVKVSYKDLPGEAYANRVEDQPPALRKVAPRC